MRLARLRRKHSFHMIALSSEASDHPNALLIPMMQGSIHHTFSFRQRYSGRLNPRLTFGGLPRLSTLANPAACPYHSATCESAVSTSNENMLVSAMVRGLTGNVWFANMSGVIRMLSNVRRT